MRRCSIWPILMTGAVALGGCSRIRRDAPTLPEAHTLVREQLVIHSDFPLATQHRLVEDVTARRFDLARTLALPVSNEPIHIYLFEDAAPFRAFIRAHHPEFSDRRALFVETDTRLIVYAHWGDRVAEDLRHEVTHGYLHSIVPALPLWLDEGLAEYFEVRRGQDGMNRVHLDQLLARLDQGQWRPDLERLERFESAWDMTQEDYAESWAWVHFLLRSRVEHCELLQAYVEHLRREGAAAPMSLTLGRLPDQGGAALIEHLRRLGAEGHSA